MEWTAPAILLDVRPYGEADAIAAVLTEQHGRHRGLVRGGTARAHAATWQTGNLLQVRWVGRLSEQLGAYTAELVHATAALALDDPLALGMLTAACAVAEGCLPEREPHPAAFTGLLALLAHLPEGTARLADLVRWETALLAELGYGLDLTRCKVTGSVGDLRYVSPRSGCAVSMEGAGEWASRLLALPRFLRPEARPNAQDGPEDWRDGLRLTGHFLSRDAFGLQHRPLPAARLALYERVAALAEASRVAESGR